MNYLIPANTKRGQLILGLFRPFDLILFLSILVISPAVICGLLVTPVPYYHNILTIIIELYDFLTTNQKYYWKGWCFMNDKENRRK